MPGVLPFPPLSFTKGLADCLVRGLPPTAAIGGRVCGVEQLRDEAVTPERRGGDWLSPV